MSRLKQVLFFLPALLWYVLIWRLSAQPAYVSDGVSDEVMGDVLTAGGSGYGDAAAFVREAVEELLSLFVRKGAHLFLFFVLALLVWLALSRFLKKRPQRALCTLIVCILLAALDEFHQSMVPGRSAELRDVLVDLGGILIALALFALPFLSRRLRETARPELLWLFGLLPGGVLLVYVGLLDHLPSLFAHRATQLDFFMELDSGDRAALLAEAAPILRQALYLFACAVAGLISECLAVLSGSKRAMQTALAASALLCALAGLVWGLPLLPGILLSLIAGCGALVVWAAMPLLEK